MSATRGTPPTLDAICEWCGAPVVLDDGIWTDRTYGGGDFCQEGLDVGPTGTSPHKPEVAHMLPCEDGRWVEYRPTLFPDIPSHVDNGFHTGNRADGKHYWLTPPDLYAALDAEFHFDFDPCPYPLPDGFDGLTCEWGQSNYVNPPFGSIWHEGRLKGPTAWARKAIEEHRKGKTVVLVYPMHKWRLMLLDEMGSGVRNLGDVHWLATEDGSVGPGTGEHIACFVLRAN